MKARTGARGWLTAVLLVGFWSQAALAAAHPPLHFAFSHGHDERAGEGHDPASCDLCEIISQLRAQLAGVLVVCLALPDEIIPLTGDAELALTARPDLRGPDARAPPGCSIT